MINWLFIEVYCRRKEDGACPSFCEKTGKPSYACLSNQCPYLDFTSCENALAYIGKDSCAKEPILLGDGEDLALWERICQKKLNEAWEEYLANHPDTQ